MMRPIVDNLERLIDSDEEERYQDEQELQGQDRRDICKRTDPDRSNEFHQRPFICEDLSDHRRGAEHDSNQVKGIITRAGKGTKIILLGDPNQIDRPFLDERTNGLSYASEYMKGQSFMLSDYNVCRRM